MSYKVPFVNYPEHYRRIWDEVMYEINEALSNGDLIVRDQLENFEKDIASYIGTKYAIGVNSGTDALILSLMAAGIGRGDEVITVAHTFVATIASIAHCGARSVLIDVGDDMNMDVNLIEQAITPRTKAIIPVHLNGRLCDMKRIMEIAEDHDLLVVEDAAQALGASLDEKKGGSFGLTGCFSFYPAKILGCAGDGGLVSTNDEVIADKVRLLRDHGLRRSTGEIIFYGFTSRLDNIQAAILSIKLRQLPEWIKRRRTLSRMYYQELSKIDDNLLLPPYPDEDDNFFDVYQNYVIRTVERDKLKNYLNKFGIETIVSWPIPLHKQRYLKLGLFNLPKTEKISDEVISLPMYPELLDTDIFYIVNILKKYFHQIE